MNQQPPAAAAQRPALGRQYADIWEQFEREKERWIQDHPGATPQEETEAVRQIARRYGI